MKNNTYHLLVYIGFIVITGFVLFLWIAPKEVGINPDSTIYLGGARSLLSGTGYLNNGAPITHYPPLYSTILATIGLVNNNLVQAARILNAILFGVSLGLVALAVYLSTGRNFMISTLATLFLATLAPIHFLYFWAWSEPLFIIFTLASIIVLTIFVQRRTLFLFITSSLFLGLVMVTRYIGIAFLPVALVIVFIGEGGQHIGRRIRNTLLWFMLACTPLGILIVTNTMVAGSATNRSFVFHPTSQFIFNLIKSVYLFLAPTSLPSVVRPVIFGLLLSMLIGPLLISIKTLPKNINWRSLEIMMPVACILFFISYLFFLFLSMSFFDASTPVDMRIMSPIFVIVIVGFFPTMWVISQKLNKPIVWFSYLLFVVISISIQTNEAIKFSAVIQKNGLGNTSYTSRQWQDSESIAFIKLLPDNVKLFSNGSDALDFLTTRQSLAIPQKISSTSMKVNLHYDDEIEAMCTDINKNRTLLVYINLVDWKWNLPTQEELESTCHLSVLQRFTDGIIYGEKLR